MTNEFLVGGYPNANNSGPTNSVNGVPILAICYAFPDGDCVYEIMLNAKRTSQPKKFVCTAEDTYLVYIEEKKNSEVLALYDAMTGEFIQTVKLNYPAYKDITSMVAIPRQPHLVGLIDSEKGVIMNVTDKKVSRIRFFYCSLTTDNDLNGDA